MKKVVVTKNAMDSYNKQIYDRIQSLLFLPFKNVDFPEIIWAMTRFFANPEKIPAS